MKTAAATRLASVGQSKVRVPNEGSEIPGRRQPAAPVESLNGLQEMRLKKSGQLVEVRPNEEPPADFSFRLRRILVPIAFDEASSVARDYASALAQRFGSELAVLYTFQNSDYAQSSNVEAELRTFCSTLRLRRVKYRVFLRPGPTGEQVKAVANALGADLIVASSDYHRRFLSYLTRAETGILRVEGVACPVVVVNAVVMEPKEGPYSSSTVRTSPMVGNLRDDPMSETRAK